MTSLDGWENFYVIVGSSAAALTGLMFVVITLTAERRTDYEDGALNAFATPTVVHFCFVLLIAAIVSTPRHTIESLAVCLAIAGAAGLAYTSVAAVRMRRQKQYTPVLEDWIFHAILPISAYTVITGAALLLWQRSELMLYMVGAGALMLLYIGIHNSWDAAIWMAVHEQKARPPQ